MDTEMAVQQAVRMIEAGAEYVRFTAQGEREARQLGVIREALRTQGYDTPLVADIHFNPNAADMAAVHVEKVRINPGNYVDRGKTFKQTACTEESYGRTSEYPCTFRPVSCPVPAAWHGDPAGRQPWLAV